MKANAVKERIMKIVFLAAACVSVLAVVLIPAMGEIGVFDFLFGKTWKPGNNLYGILPMILGSIYVTAGAIIIGVPIALLTAIFLAKFCPKKIYGFCKAGINLMAGVPSVVYGFFGLVVIVPLVKQIFGIRSGMTMLTASILLAIMILPTIIGVTESALQSVPEGYGARGHPYTKRLFHYGACGKIRDHCRDRAGHRPGYWGDDGGDHGGRQPDANAQGAAGGRAHTDLQHRYGNGVCGRSSPGSAHRYRRRSVCLYYDHQPYCIGTETEGCQ